MSFDCKGPELTIGRVSGNDIVLRDPGTSKRHARLVIKDGRFIVVDMKSTNGTYVNGQRITAPRVVKPGDAIVIAEFLLSIEQQSAVAKGERLLTGRVVTSVTDLIVVEAQVIGDDLLWAPDGAVRVISRSGAASASALIADQSTRAGPVKQGQVIRIAAGSLGGGLPRDPCAILVESGAGVLRVEL